jgi:EpsI family protein
MPKTPKMPGPVTKGLFLSVMLILVLQTAASRMLSIPERDVPIPELRRLPSTVGKWRAGSEQVLESNVVAYLKPDDYIIRDYVNGDGRNSINLFVAHFKSLQDSYGPHSPRVCLPGAGWLVRSAKIETVPVPGRVEGIPVNEYILEKSVDRILVVYWYQSNRAVWAEEFQAKLKLLPDLIRYRRSDVSLVRLIAPIQGGAGENELRDCLEFTRLVFPSLVDRFASAN